MGEPVASCMSGARAALRLAGGAVSMLSRIGYSAVAQVTPPRIDWSNFDDRRQAASWFEIRYRSRALVVCRAGHAPRVDEVSKGRCGAVNTEVPKMPGRLVKQC